MTPCVIQRLRKFSTSAIQLNRRSSNIKPGNISRQCVWFFPSDFGFVLIADIFFLYKKICKTYIPSGNLAHKNAVFNIHGTLKIMLFLSDIWVTWVVTLVGCMEMTSSQVVKMSVNDNNIIVIIILIMRIFTTLSSCQVL